MGSVLSDYTKPTIIRRKKDGVSSEEESEDEDQVDGGRRRSGDGGSNEGKHGIVRHMRIQISLLFVLFRNIFCLVFCYVFTIFNLHLIRASFCYEFLLRESLKFAS